MSSRKQRRERARVKAEQATRARLAAIDADLDLAEAPPLFAETARRVGVVPAPPAALTAPTVLLPTVAPRPLPQLGQLTGGN